MVNNNCIRINAVYYVEPKPGFNPIAIRPKIQHGFISWSDTGRGRSIKYEAILLNGVELNEPLSPLEEIPDRIEIRGRQRESLHLVKLTKQIFEEIVKKEVVCGEDLMNIESDEALQNYYLTTNFGY